MTTLIIGMSGLERPAIVFGPPGAAQCRVPLQELELTCHERQLSGQSGKCLRLWARTGFSSRRERPAWPKAVNYGLEPFKPRVPMMQPILSKLCPVPARPGLKSDRALVRRRRPLDEAVPRCSSVWRRQIGAPFLQRRPRRIPRRAREKSAREENACAQS